MAISLTTNDLLPSVAFGSVADSRSADSMAVTAISSLRPSYSVGIVITSSPPKTVRSLALNLISPRSTNPRSLAIDSVTVASIVQTNTHDSPRDSLNRAPASYLLPTSPRVSAACAASTSRGSK